MKESRLITRGTVFAVSLAFFSASGFAQASSDKLLGTLKAELAHNYAQLQKQQVKPYFMSYRADSRRQDGRRNGRRLYPRGRLQ